MIHFQDNKDYVLDLIQSEIMILHFVINIIVKCFFLVFLFCSAFLSATIQLFIAGLPSMCWGTQGTEFEPATAQPQGVMPAP